MALGLHKYEQSIAQNESQNSSLKYVKLVEACPRCGSNMELETIESGPKLGRQYFRCVLYPTCRGKINLSTN